MSKLKVSGFTVSIDGYGAGPRQSLDNPLGVGGGTLHEWLVGTRTFQKMLGGEGGATGRRRRLRGARPRRHRRLDPGT